MCSSSMPSESAHLATPNPRRHFAVALLSIVVGAFVGLVGAAFRILLSFLDSWRTYLIERAHALGSIGVPMVVVGIAVCGAIAAWLVFRVAPEASGSGIPHVEHELKTGSVGNPLPTIIVKFIGGILAIGGGFALGREGPTVQMGGGIGQLIGRAFGTSLDESRTLLAAGAGAGLATAFNAPIAGSVFVLEELFGSFNVTMAITTLGASASAICVSRVFLGQAPDFVVRPLEFINFGVLPVSILIGIVMGLLGVAYSRCILAGLRFSQRFSQLSGGLRAGAIGAVISLIGWFAPRVIGGGEVITQRTLDANLTLLALASILTLRFFLGPLSYAGRTPGGLFAPMLVIGSQAGFLFFLAWSHFVPSVQAVPQQFAIVGMAAFFAAVVRTPLTGIILAVELTGGVPLFLPMLGASFAAAATAEVLKQPAIYDSLRTVR